MADRNGNENCLEGYECPDCGESESLYVWAVTKSLMRDSGTEETYEMEYDKNSRMDCPSCGHGGKSSLFEIKNHKNEASKNAEVD